MELLRTEPAARCRECRKVISFVAKYYDATSETKYVYKEINSKARYIDQWGFARNFCCECMDSFNR